MSNLDNLLIIADDFGMAQGVNRAIIELCDQKLLNGISIMVTGGFYKNYLPDLSKQKTVNNIKLGLHLDLTFGQAQYRARNNLIVDQKGVFKNGFLKIFLLSIFKPKTILRVLYREINQQIQKITTDLGKIDYLDGHQHIHTIPLIFKITQKLATKYQIPRLRIINENLFTSFDFKNPPSPIALIKFAVLKFCYLINNTKTKFYFYSILYSCKINQKAIAKIAKLKKENIEIMIHPGYSKIDFDDKNNREYRHITSKYRDIERISLVANFGKEV